MAWQLMHIGITEELFATERLVAGTKPAFADLVPRFKGGSKPDDEIPPAALIRQVLTESRAHLWRRSAASATRTSARFPKASRSASWPLADILHILAWHEPHHQGQAHITFNLYKAAHG